MRGCQKRVIYLKNTGSEYFDEAYFVLKNSTNSKNRSDTDVIREANRIIEENIGKRKHFNYKKWLPLVLAFTVGAVVSALVFG